MQYDRTTGVLSIALHPSKISQSPKEIIASLKETEEKVFHENRRLTKELEGKKNKSPL